MLIALAVCVASAISAVTPLQRERPIQREMSGGDSHSYTVTLAAGDFIRVVFDQRGIDVVVAAYGPDEKKIAEVDSPNGANGPEPVEFVALAAGTYRFEVRSFEKNATPGKYEARIEQWMTAPEYAAHLAAKKAEEESASSEIRRLAVPLRFTTAGHGFDDLAPLADIVGDARVVALGEATHGTREFFQLKHRLLEFLVERKGFNVFAIEATMPEAFDINEYVLSGKGDGRKALAALYFWTWDTEEVLDMIEWMRRYNADSSHARKIKFYGVDMQEAQRAYKVSLAYLEGVDPTAFREAKHTLDFLGNAFTNFDYDGLSEGDKKSVAVTVHNLLARFDERKTDYVMKTGETVFAVARQHAQVLAQNIEQRQAPNDWRIRDRAMAHNAQWILDHEGAGAKMVLWAHNAHVRSVPEGWMGSYLRKAYGDALVVFGFAFNEGSFQARDIPNAASKGVPLEFTVKAAPAGSFDSIAAGAGVSSFVIDLRHLPDSNPLAKWLSEPQSMREIGSVYDPATANAFFRKHKVRDEYDAVVFVANTTAAKPNARAPGQAYASLPAPANLDFEAVSTSGLPDQWIVPEAAFWSDYEIGSTASNPHTGQRAGLIRRGVGKHYSEDVGMLSQRIDATPFRGKRIRVRAFSRKTAASDPAYVFLTVRRGFAWQQLPAAFRDRRLVTTSDWKQYVIEGDVAKDAAEISYGLVLAGSGEASLDTVSVEAVEARAGPRH